MYKVYPYKLKNTTSSPQTCVRFTDTRSFLVPHVTMTDTPNGDLFNTSLLNKKNQQKDLQENHRILNSSQVYEICTLLAVFRFFEIDHKAFSSSIRVSSTK
jgi:hypothetical protein